MNRLTNFFRSRALPRLALAVGFLGVAALPAGARASEAGSPVADALRRADERVKAIIDVPSSQRTFDNTIGAIDDIIANLELDTNMTQFLAYVSTDAAVRDAGRQAEEEVMNWLIELGKNEALYRAVQSYADTSPALEGEQQRLLRDTLRDYRRAGMALSPAQREELKAIEKELTRLSIQFEQAIRDDETMVPVTREELTGMSDDFIDGLDRSGDIYFLGMDYPTFLPLLDFCEDETTRKKVWLAYKRRGGRKNVQTIEQILELRAQAADILGYAHPADYETEVRMAKNAANVMAFYHKLRPLVREKAKLDWQEFVEAKREHTGNDDATLWPWDYSFYLNHLKKTKYAVDARKVREYFPLERVIDGLFSITQSLYGLEYRDVTARAASMGKPLWHEDVSLYEVHDTRTGEMLGEFYLDLHPRPNKYSHAAQWGLAQHKIWLDGRVTRPVAALVCNFTKPTADKPSLMSHEEVVTFFHEFGHCLHTILSDRRYFTISGTNVERDFVEAPSQMFENWVWNADVLKTFTAHYESGAPLPDDILEGMIAAKNLGSGLAAEHQFYYGLVDMAFHTDPEGDVDTTEVANAMFAEVEMYQRIPGVYYHASFGHLTGYQAGYYGYQWSLVYASDMFQRFKELGMLDPEAGMYYREKILSRGGSADAMDMVRDYLGREPDMSAYLRHLGLEGEGN